MSFLNNLLKPALNFFINSQAKKHLPKYNSTLKAVGLDKPVEIIRDKWGVPHIYAANQKDLFFAQGFVHAQERLWQMELTRRVVAGRLCEVVGKDALEVDRLTRIMGFKALGKKDEANFAKHELFPILKSYVNGINFYLQEAEYPPVEFKLLKIKPEQWTVSDCFGLARMLAMQMSQGWLHELERLGLAKKFGVEKVQEIFPKYPLQNPTALKFGIETNKMANGALEAFKGPYLRPLGGSNNWVVAANKMETGSAALCNDPHLLVGTPNIWFENHLIAPDYENTGVSIPGSPLVLIGHNRAIAWGATLSYADIQDTYIEDFTSKKGLQYRYDGRILKASVHTEKIYIKGEKQPHEERVIATHHGPVIMDLDDTKKISLCSKALQDNEMILGFYALNMAKDWDDFVAGCHQLTIPSLSLVYADTQNNIGYYMTGEVPIRKKQKGLLPNSGSDGEHEWTGIVPFEEMPHVLNPEQGYFYTCNHKIVADDFPYDLGNIWMNGYRAKRLDSLFLSKDKFNFNDFANWQLDFFCAPGLEFAALVRELKEAPAFNSLKENGKKAAELLINWDGNLTADCIGGTVYQVLKQELIDILFERYVGVRGEVSYSQISIFEMGEFFGHDTTTLLRLFENPGSPWWKDTPSQTLANALQGAADYLSTTLSQDAKFWQWGKLHKMSAKHALSVKAPLDQIFDVGNEPIGGDTDTVCQVATLPGKHYGGSMIAASYRQMIDMGNLANSTCAAPVGQSGNLKSPHYKDQFKMWMKGEYKPMVWTKEQVEEYKASKDVLTPK